MKIFLSIRLITNTTGNEMGPVIGVKRSAIANESTITNPTIDALSYGTSEA